MTVMETVGCDSVKLPLKQRAVRRAEFVEAYHPTLANEFLRASMSKLPPRLPPVHKRP